MLSAKVFRLCAQVSAHVCKDWQYAIKHYSPFHISAEAYTSMYQKSWTLHDKRVMAITGGAL